MAELIQMAQDFLSGNKSNTGAGGSASARSNNQAGSNQAA